LNFRPKTSLSRRLSSIGLGKNILVRNPKFLSTEKVKWCTSSGSNLKRIGRMSDLYIEKKFHKITHFKN